jgi:hypothetical protein
MIPTPPRIMLATLVLNELHWLPTLIEQHQNWPGLHAWVFVEAADQAYAEAAPDAVSPEGLSTDGTTEWLRSFVRAQKDSKIPEGFWHAPYGFVGNGGPQGKVAARNAYLHVAEIVHPDWIVVLDADEFYTHDAQARIAELLNTLVTPRPPVLLNQRHIWRPDSITHEPLCKLEAVGGYWSISHLRIWPWYPGVEYRTNHNNIELPGTQDDTLRKRLVDMRKYNNSPECVHMAFASPLEGRQYKHTYYIQRGEGPKDGRQRYVDCRAAWETWKPGDSLPQGARVQPYTGPIPEVFR